MLDVVLATLVYFILRNTDTGYTPVITGTNSARAIILSMFSLQVTIGIVEDGTYPRLNKRAYRLCFANRDMPS